MKAIAFLHSAIVILFSILNGIMLYLFLMRLPYGIDPFVLSLYHWDKMTEDKNVIVTICFILAIVTSVVLPRISEMWKNRLLYMRWLFPHPAFNAFLCNRKQPFETNQLLEAYPEVKDSGFSARVQVQVWQRLSELHAQVPVVVNTKLHWQILRDIYLLALVFLAAFLLGWLYNLRLGIPFQLVSPYLFLFGAQVLFMLMLAKKVGLRYVDNVLGTALGIQEDTGKSKKGKKKK